MYLETQSIIEISNFSDVYFFLFNSFYSFSLSVGSNKIDVNFTKIPYEDALQACNTEKFPIDGMTAYAISLRINRQPSQTPVETFWLPNGEMNKNQGRFVTIFKSIDQRPLF